MHLTCKAQDLREAVNIVKPGIDFKSSLQEYSAILFKAADNSLELSGYNSNYYMNVKIEAIVLEPGELAVKAKFLHNLVRYFQGEEIKICSRDDSKLRIECGTYTGDILYFGPEGYPDFPAAQKLVAFDMPFRDFVDMVNGSIYEKSNALTYSTQCIHMKIKDKKLTLVGTDGRRYSKIYKEINTKKDISALLYGDVLSNIITVLSKGENSKNISVSICSNCVIFEFYNITLYSRINYEETYPDLICVFDAEYNYCFTVSKRNFLLSIERAIAIYDNSLYIAEIKATDSSFINITAESNMGNSNDELYVVIGKKNFTMRVKCEHLIEALNSLCEEEVTISINKQQTGYMLRNKNTDNYTYYLPFLYG